MVGTRLIKFRNRDPRRNLPLAVSSKRGEANFLGAFERALMAEQKVGMGGRHFELAGYGVTDLIWINRGWDLDMKRNSKKIQKKAQNRLCHLTAFEMKLENWRKALLQAYRFSYFADRAIVVLPTENVHRAQAHLHLCCEMDVGLWAFDQRERLIERIHTPKRAKARNLKAKNKALRLLSSYIDLG